MFKEKFLRIVWPAFLAACVLELLVFVLVDPSDLSWSGQPLELSRQGIYTAAFFVFWGVCMSSNALTALLGQPPAEFNRCPLASGERPDGCPQSAAQA